MPIDSFRRGILALGCSALLAGCNPTYVSGRVLNTSGETLPGVTVSLAGADNEVLTGVLGEYRLQGTPGEHELAFAKSGYAPARLAIDFPGAGGAEAEPVTLWQLPSKAGVYIFEAGRYLELARETPGVFVLAPGEKVHAIQRPPRLATDASNPFIVCYATPRHDVRLSRLDQADAMLGMNPESKIPVWIAAGTMGATLRSIDEPGGMLLRLDLDRPLEPGVYAVHWGAMDGRTTLDDRAFLFEVTGPMEPPGPLESIEPEGAEMEAP